MKLDSDIKAKDKALLIPHLTKINAVFERYANATLIDEESRKKVLQIARTIEFWFQLSTHADVAQDDEERK